MYHLPHTGETVPPTHREVPDGAGTWSLASSFADRSCPAPASAQQQEPWSQQPHPPADPYAQHQLQVQLQLQQVLPSPRPLPSPVLVTVVARYINTHELVQPLPPMPQGLSPFQQAAWLQSQLDALKQSGSSGSARAGRPHIKNGPFLQLPFPIELRGRHGGICCKAFGVLHLDRYLSDKPCIEVPGRRGFMSRSAFEQLGGALLARWYRSILAVETMQTMEVWLGEHGLEVKRGQPRGNVHGNANANAKAGQEQKEQQQQQQQQSAAAAGGSDPDLVLPAAATSTVAVPPSAVITTPPTACPTLNLDAPTHAAAARAHLPTTTTTTPGLPVVSSYSFPAAPAAPAGVCSPPPARPDGASLPGTAPPVPPLASPRAVRSAGGAAPCTPLPTGHPSDSPATPQPHVPQRTQTPSYPQLAPSQEPQLVPPALSLQLSQGRPPAPWSVDQQGHVPRRGPSPAPGRLALSHGGFEGVADCPLAPAGGSDRTVSSGISVGLRTGAGVRGSARPPGGQGARQSQGQGRDVERAQGAMRPREDVVMASAAAPAARHHRATDGGHTPSAVHQHQQQQQYHQPTPVRAGPTSLPYGTMEQRTGPIGAAPAAPPQGPQPWGRPLACSSPEAVQQQQQQQLHGRPHPHPHPHDRALVAQTMEESGATEGGAIAPPAAPEAAEAVASSWSNRPSPRQPYPHFLPGPYPRTPGYAPYHLPPYPHRVARRLFRPHRHGAAALDVPYGEAGPRISSLSAQAAPATAGSAGDPGTTGHRPHVHPLPPPQPHPIQTQGDSPVPLRQPPGYPHSYGPYRRVMMRARHVHPWPPPGAVSPLRRVASQGALPTGGEGPAAAPAAVPAAAPALAHTSTQGQATAPVQMTQPAAWDPSCRDGDPSPFEGPPHVRVPWRHALSYPRPHPYAPSLGEDEIECSPSPATPPPWTGGSGHVPLPSSGASPRAQWPMGRWAVSEGGSLPPYHLQQHHHTHHLPHHQGSHYSHQQQHHQQQQPNTSQSLPPPYCASPRSQSGPAPAVAVAAAAASLAPVPTPAPSPRAACGTPRVATRSVAGAPADCAANSAMGCADGPANGDHPNTTATPSGMWGGTQEPGPGAAAAPDCSPAWAAHPAADAHTPAVPGLYRADPYQCPPLLPHARSAPVPDSRNSSMAGPMGAQADSPPEVAAPQPEQLQGQSQHAPWQLQLQARSGAEVEGEAPGQPLRLPALEPMQQTSLDAEAAAQGGQLPSTWGGPPSYPPGGAVHGSASAAHCAGGGAGPGALPHAAPGHVHPGAMQYGHSHQSHRNRQGQHPAWMGLDGIAGTPLLQGHTRTLAAAGAAATSGVGAGAPQDSPMHQPSGIKTPSAARPASSSSSFPWHSMAAAAPAAGAAAGAAGANAGTPSGAFVGGWGYASDVGMASAAETPLESCMGDSGGGGAAGEVPGTGEVPGIVDVLMEGGASVAPSGAGAGAGGSVGLEDAEAAEMGGLGPLMALEDEEDWMHELLNDAFLQ